MNFNAQEKSGWVIKLKVDLVDGLNNFLNPTLKKIITTMWTSISFYSNTFSVECKTGGIFIIQLTIFLNIIRIFFEYYSYMLKVKNMYHIHYSTFLNIIRIFSKSYSYILKMQNKCHIHYSVIYIFEYYPYIFRILFVYVENVK